MPFQLYTYRRIGDLEKMIVSMPKTDGRIFLGAGTDDRQMIQDLLRTAKYGFKVFSWDDLYRTFAALQGGEKARIQLDPPDHWLLLNGITAARRRIKDAPMPPGASRRGFLKILGAQIRELISEEITPEHLERLYAEDDEAGQALIALYRDYLNSLDANGLADSAGITTETRRLLELPEQQEACRTMDIVFAGFSSFTHSQLSLVRALVACGADVTVCAPVAGVEKEYGAREQFGVDGIPLSGRQPWHTVRLCGSDPRGEFETAAHELILWESGKGRLAQLGAFPGWNRIAMSVPSARLKQARQAFSRYGLPCCWSFRSKVSDTPLMTMSDLCLEAASGGWQTEQTLKLLALPWLCGSSIEPEAVRERHPRGIKKWENALEGNERAMEAFAACREYADAVLKKGGTGKDLLSALKKFAAGRDVMASRDIAGHPELDSTVKEYADALSELERRVVYIQEVVRDLGDLGLQVLRGSDARAFLDAWADGTGITPPRFGTSQMNVFADAPSTLYHVPYWFIFGAESGKWPGGLKESPLIDEAHKQRLHEDSSLELSRCHLPLLSEKRTDREFLFRRLIACGDMCTVICRSAFDDENHPIDETPLVDRAVADGWVKMEDLGIESTGLLVPEGEVLVRGAEGRRPDPRVWGGLPKERLMPAPGTPSFASGVGNVDTVKLSSVDSYAGCPYMFAVSTLLGFAAPADDSEFNSVLAGTAMHGIWLRAWRERPNGYNIKFLAEKFFDEEFERVYPALLHDDSLRRIRGQLRYRLSACAARQDDIYDVLRSRIAETHCEYVLPEMEREGIRFTGRCDRLDVLDNDSFFLWDYKSGKSANYTTAVQLACYALALEKAETFGRCAGWGYICLADGKVAGVCDPETAGFLGEQMDVLALVSKKGQKLETEMQRADEVLGNIAQSIKTVSFPYDHDSKSCSWCEYQGLCRRSELRSRFESENERQDDADEGND